MGAGGMDRQADTVAEAWPSHTGPGHGGQPGPGSTRREDGSFQLASSKPQSSCQWTANLSE